MLSADGRKATLDLVTAVIDQPKWPDRDAPWINAAMSLKVVWEATDEKVLIEDKAKHFRFEGFRATARAEAKVSIPGLDFSWNSDPLNTSKADFAVIGTEVNGKYFDEGIKT